MLALYLSCVCSNALLAGAISGRKLDIEVRPASKMNKVMRRYVASKLPRLKKPSRTLTTLTPMAATA